MIAENFLKGYEKYESEFKLGISSDFISKWIITNNITSETLDVLAKLFSDMVIKKQEAVVAMLKRLSRIPQLKASTFENFDTSLLNENAAKQVMSLKTLSFIPAKRNVIMIGPPGTGKTHLAMAIGNECSTNELKSYFIKMSELKAKFHNAITDQTTGSLLKGLSKFSCIIIDEMGYCRFNKEETLLFFQLVDRISLKETGSIVITSNKSINDWVPFFEDDDALECTLDRLYDKAIILNFSGVSYRGRGKEVINVNFQKLR